MKSILLSIKPEWLAKILNGEKTIEVRKNKALANAIKELIKQYGKALIYMYCSKDKKFPLVLSSDGESYQEYCNAKYYPPFIRGDVLNGKVIARFWCDKVEEISVPYPAYFNEVKDKLQHITDKSCLSLMDLHHYLGNKNGYAIHISKLEIFDKPKELSEFKRYHEPSEHSACWKCKRFGTGCVSCSITKAPQNYCYVEEELL